MQKKGKKQRSITISVELYDWINEQIEKRQFKDFSHAVELAVYELRERRQKQVKS